MAEQFEADPSKANPGTYTRASCGCVMWTQEDIFVYVPCAFTCENYQYMLGASARAGHPIELREDPG